LTRQLGTRIPLEAERGYHLMLPRPGVNLRIPLVNRDHNFTMTPMDNGLRLAAPRSSPGWMPARLSARPHAARAGPRNAPGAERRGRDAVDGLPPVAPGRTADHRPLAEFRPRVLRFRARHFGLSEAPTTGKLIAELIGGRPPSIDIAPYRATRFQ